MGVGRGGGQFAHEHWAATVLFGVEGRGIALGTFALAPSIAAPCLALTIFAQSWLAIERVLDREGRKFDSSANERTNEFCLP